jgi:DNA-binding transcriptional LysR family regulator
MGMIGTTARWLAPRLLEHVAEEHPQVHLIIADATSTTLEPLLAAGLLDLGVVTLPIPAPDLIGRPLFDEDLVLVVERNHPYATRPLIDITDLDRMALLLPAPGTAFRGDLEAAAAGAGVTLVPKAELDGLRLIASLTFDGYGPAILPATAIPPRLEDHYVRIPVQGLPYRRVGVATRRRGRPSAPARAVVAVIDRIIATDVDSRSGLHLPAA